jgi:uncharacterized protein with PIN domain
MGAAPRVIRRGGGRLKVIREEIAKAGKSIMTEKKLTEEQRIKLERIGRAFDDHFAGKPSSVRCPECNELLEVTHLEVFSSIWVTCPNGCISSHFSYAKVTE